MLPIEERKRRKAAGSRRWYYRNADRIKERISLWSAEDRLNDKIACLSHYGKDGKLQCCWPGCPENDIDVLTIDHINNDGHHRKGGISGHQLYKKLVKSNFPEGFQTLCANHQLKKELLRRREAKKYGKGTV